MGLEQYTGQATQFYNVIHGTDHKEFPGFFAPMQSTREAMLNTIIEPVLISALPQAISYAATLCAVGFLIAAVYQAVNNDMDAAKEHGINAGIAVGVALGSALIGSLATTAALLWAVCRLGTTAVEHFANHQADKEPTAAAAP